MDVKPLVSIACAAYNHEPYIRQCLDGFVMQKTNFRFEVVVHDDASTDNTADIIREYESKYPDIIKPIYQTKNYGMGSEYTGRMKQKAWRGKYLAFCEGDDYWTDPLKLQKQVDFLQENPDCSLSFHPTAFDHQDVTRNFIQRPKQKPKDSKFEMKHAILGGGGFIASSSMVFLREYANIRPHWIRKCPVSDLPLMLLLASKGKLGYIDDVMSTYRVMALNSWSCGMNDKNKKREHHFAMLEMWADFDQWSGYKYHIFISIKKFKNSIIYYRGLLKNFIINL